MTGPTVSVLMLSWQHGPYIREAIESVVSQESDVEIELVIGDDNSLDDSWLLCKEYQALYPEKVRIFPSAKNVGMHANFARLWQSARGEYIAFCEGDDYWSDSRKVSKQAEFLRKNTDCSLCGTFTRKIALGETGEWESAGEICPSVVKEKYSFEELISGYHFHFSSVMLRRNAVVFPDWFQTVYCVDRPLYLLAAVNGKAGLLPEFTSVYRLHDGGNWSSISMEKKAQGSTDLFLKMRDYFPPQYRRRFEATLGAILWSYMAQDLHSGNRVSARRIFWQSLRYTPLSRLMLNAVDYCKVLLHLYLPFLLPGKKEQSHSF